DVTLGVANQSGPRGGQAITLENWEMLMASRKLGPGFVDLRFMSSLEPFTMPPGGMPQLLQTGETFRGKPLVDRQHPHELFMEVAARYSFQPVPWAELFVYGGPVGEPALGPPAYIHRPSAEDNRWAPLSHHLQDATHMAMGVGTAGLRLRDFQVEGSLFNGREPDENRTDIEFKPWDSYSVRLSYAPGDNLVFQLSSGYLTSPEALDPGDILRTTASLQLAGRLGGRMVTGMASWGQNQGKAGHPARTLQSYLLEGTAELGWMLKTYSRAEVVDKDTLDLAGVHDHTVHRVSAVTLGLVRELGDFETFGLALGADATFNILDEPATRVYGLNPLGFRAYVRLGPPARHMM
ncbi:MAG: hypothetical protein FJZ00_13200, partial [Candidatus Sericytochromatia bacterium]|nr:hypothetical protein [Candidatus Tanganyikabacteria bacterium]